MTKVTFPNAGKLLPGQLALQDVVPQGTGLSGTGVLEPSKPRCDCVVKKIKLSLYLQADEGWKQYKAFNGPPWGSKQHSK